MIQDFTLFIRDQQLFSEEEKVLLAVSGGMDSMAMAELFYRAGYNFAFAHCNFRLRGEESDGDEAFVKKIAIQFGVQVYSQAFETETIANKAGISIQMAARDIRYQYFEKIAMEEGFNHIATAHHLDDQTETFFINLLRGCGIAGLHGIAVKKDKIIRPMMFASRNEIEAFVGEHKLAYREDSSNQSTYYQRNKIRHELMPLLRELNPNVDNEMVANIARLADTEKIYQKYIEQCRSEHVRIEDDTIFINKSRLKDLAPLGTILFELISPYGFRNDDVRNIINTMEGDAGKVFLSKTHQLVIDRDEIIISELENIADPDQEFMICEDARVINDPLNIEIGIFEKDTYQIRKDISVACLNLDKLRFPLTLRRWREGDYFCPLGMDKRKKLSDFFIDEKYSLLDKQRAWLLCSGEDIVWIVGHRIDDRYKITESTRKVFEVTLLE